MKRAQSTQVLTPLPAPIEEGERSPLPSLLLIGFLGVTTIAAVVMSNGSPAAALGPCLMALMVWAPAPA